MEMEMTYGCKDSFSWRRVGEIARFYWPYIRKQMIIYPIASIVGIGIVILSASTGLGNPIFSALTTMLSFMFMFAPVAFSARNGLDVETVLPATGAEKSTFIIGYTIIIVPVLIYVPAFICYCLFKDLLMADPDFMRIMTLREELVRVTYGFSLVQDVAPVATCLYVVMKRTTNRTLLGMVWAVVTLVAVGFMGAIYGFFMALMGKFNCGSSNDPIALVNMVTAGIEPFITVVGVILLIYIIFVLYRTAKVISNRQI